MTVFLETLVYEQEIALVVSESSLLIEDNIVDISNFGIECQSLDLCILMIALYRLTTAIIIPRFEVVRLYHSKRIQSAKI